MIKVGVIGLGPVWESFRPVLSQLRQPLKVVAVYDPLPQRAAQTAKELKAAAVLGISALALRADVQAVLVTDPSWVGATAIDLLAQCQKPVFIAPWLPCQLDSTERWYSATEQRGITLMPAMWRRFMPAAIRLKELLATELGEPLEIRLPLDVSAFDNPTDTTEAVLGWLDFVWYLVRREPTFESASTTVTGHDWTICFPPRSPHPIEGASTKANRSCRLIVHWSGPTDLESLRHLLKQGSDRSAPVNDRVQFEQLPVPRIELACEHGAAIILDRTSVAWRRGTSDEITEQLASERPERLVMLDHFSRRAVGGLIPVSDYNDVARSLRLIG